MAVVLLLRLLAPVFSTNCYVLAPDDGAPALVVDPGAGAAPAVRAALDEHGLTVGAVVATHGHPDHVWDAAEVAGGAPVLVGAADLPRLADPAGDLGAPMAAMFRSLAGTPWREPRATAALPGPGPTELVPGVVVDAVPAPGHTPGSTLLVVGDAGQPAVVLTGDVLFAGSVGRTDLPGGDADLMTASLRRIGTTLPASARVLPGHGPETTIGREAATNPYLAAALRA